MNPKYALDVLLDPLLGCRVMRIHTIPSLVEIAEQMGNIWVSNQLQAGGNEWNKSSCLENPMDGGAW